MLGRPEIVTLSTGDRQTVNHRKSRQKSRIANGSALLPGIDGRSAWVRRCKEVIAAHLSHLNGDSAVSEAQRSLVRRIAVLTTQLEMLESKFAADNGQASAKDLDLYVRSSGVLRRLLQTIGLERRQKDITSLGSVLRAGIERQRERTS